MSVHVMLSYNQYCLGREPKCFWEGEERESAGKEGGKGTWQKWKTYLYENGLWNPVLPSVYAKKTLTVAEMTLITIHLWYK